jgi:hypothetical protein
MPSAQEATRTTIAPYGSPSYTDPNRNRYERDQRDRVLKNAHRHAAVFKLTQQPTAALTADVSQE